MPKNNQTNEKIIIDLLQKQLIISLYKEGLTRNEIAKTLSMSTNSVQSTLANLKKLRK